LTLCDRLLSSLHREGQLVVTLHLSPVGALGALDRLSNQLVFAITVIIKRAPSWHT